MAKGSSSRKKRSTRRAPAKETRDESVETKVGPSKQMKLPEGKRIEHHLANTDAYEKKLADLKAIVKKQYEAASAEGISKELLTDLRKLRDGDPIVARHYLESFGVGLKAIGAPFQLNVFDAMFEDDIAQAKAEARIHGRQGKAPECRFAEGSPAHDAYMDEYRFVQASMAPGAESLSADEIRKAMAQGAGEAAASKPAGTVNQ